MKIPAIKSLITQIQNEIKNLWNGKSVTFIPTNIIKNSYSKPLIVGGAIIVLFLAIIGYSANKTNPKSKGNNPADAKAGGNQVNIFTSDDPKLGNNPEDKSSKATVPDTKNQKIKSTTQDNPAKPQGLKSQLEAIEQETAQKRVLKSTILTNTKSQELKSQVDKGSQDLQNQKLEPNILVNTNLNENNPFDLPRYTMSKNGLLSTRAFLFEMDQRNLPENEKNNLKKWSFTQRKFIDEVYVNSTYVTRPDTNKINVQGKTCNYVDSDGYATSISMHHTGNAFFIKDDIIEEVYPCESIDYFASIQFSLGLPSTGIIPVGVYTDGKHILQQFGARACVAACAAMLCLDNGKECDVKSIVVTNVANDDNFMEFMLKSGLKAEKFLVDHNVDKLKTLINKYGSLSCCSDTEIGGHQFILDDINAVGAVIRDPFHGWRLRISTEEFFKRFDGKVLYVVK